jgi:hypothetical protein
VDTNSYTSGYDVLLTQSDLFEFPGKPTIYTEGGRWNL